jgi:hypothetical protein
VLSDHVVRLGAGSRNLCLSSTFAVAGNSVLLPLVIDLTAPEGIYPTPALKLISRGLRISTIRKSAAEPSHAARGAPCRMSLRSLCVVWPDRRVLRLMPPMLSAQFVLDLLLSAFFGNLKLLELALHIPLVAGHALFLLADR